MGSIKKYLFKRKGGETLDNNSKYVSIAIPNQKIQISSDYGETFSDSTSDDKFWFDIAMDYSGQYQIAGGGGEVYFSSNYGLDWALVATVGGTNTYVSVSGDGKYFQAAGYGGIVALSDDFGVTWSTAGGNANRRGCAHSYTGQYVMRNTYLSNGFISDDFGTSFTTILSGLRHYTCKISHTGQYQIIGLAATETARTSNDYGVTWSTPSQITSGTNFSAGISGDGKYQLIGSTDTSIWFSDDYGGSFIDIKSRMPNSGLKPNSIDVSYDGKYIFIYKRAISTSYHYSDDYGATFKAVTVPNPSDGYGGIAISKEIII